MDQKKDIFRAKITAYNNYLAGRYIYNYDYKLFEERNFLNNLCDYDFERHYVYKIREEYLTKEITETKFYKKSVCLVCQYKNDLYVYGTRSDCRYINRTNYNENEFFRFGFLITTPAPYSDLQPVFYYIILPKFMVYPISDSILDYNAGYIVNSYFTRKQELAFYNKLYSSFEKQRLFRRIKTTNYKPKFDIDYTKYYN